MSARKIMIEAWALRQGVSHGIAAVEVDALLGVIDIAGYAVVPKEPTEEMLRAYYQCMEGTHPTARMNPVKYLTHNLKANTRWRAMLTAAKETP